MLFSSCRFFTALIGTMHSLRSSLDRPVTVCSPPYRAQEKAGLKRSLVASHHAHMSNRSQLEQEVLRLKKEVARLELELADTQKVLK